MKKLKPVEILALPMTSDDVPEAKTIREYLVCLLKELWRSGEGFSGKRPFGNSGWEYDMYIPLIKAKVVRGEINGDGYLEEVDSDAARKVITQAIKAL